MITYNISINKDLADFINQIIKKYKYSNRSEFFRDLVRRVYLKEKGLEYTIEKLDPEDPDYQLVEERKKSAKMVSQAQFKKKFNLPN